VGRSGRPGVGRGGAPGPARVEEPQPGRSPARSRRSSGLHCGSRTRPPSPSTRGAPPRPTPGRPDLAGWVAGWQPSLGGWPGAVRGLPASGPAPPRGTSVGWLRLSAPPRTGRAYTVNGPARSAGAGTSGREPPDRSTRRRSLPWPAVSIKRGWMTTSQIEAAGFGRPTVSRAGACPRPVRSSRRSGREDQTPAYDPGRPTAQGKKSSRRPMGREGLPGASERSWTP
jgi:hypothetical protein